jgi:hypothetical protein
VVAPENAPTEARRATASMVDAISLRMSSSPS